MATKLTFIGAKPAATTGTDVQNAGAQTVAVADQNLANLQAAVDRSGGFTASQTPAANEIVVVKADGSTVLPGGVAVVGVDIKGSSATSTATLLQVGNILSGGKGLYFARDTADAVMGIQGTLQGVGAANITLQAGGGNILVGTSADNGSGAKLQVAGNISAGGVTVSNSADIDGLNIQNTHAAFAQYGLTVNNPNTATGNLLRLRSLATDRVVVNGGGTVLVGAVDNGSGAKLQVAGGVSAVLPVYADNTAAAALVAGTMYRTATGVVMIKY